MSSLQELVRVFRHLEYEHNWSRVQTAEALSRTLAALEWGIVYPHPLLEDGSTDYVKLIVLEAEAVLGILDEV